jgi:hypothetical protein
MELYSAARREDPHVVGSVLISLGAECIWQKEGSEMAVKLLSPSLEPLKLISFQQFSIKVSLTSTSIHFLRTPSIMNLI